MPAVIISLYNLSTISVASLVEPEVTFLILEIVCFLSPGFIRSGLYPQKKSLLNFKPEIFSKIGTHSSSTHPGYTVDSYIIIFPFFIYLPTNLEAIKRDVKSGFFNTSIGVGTVIIKQFANLSSLESHVK